MNNKICLSSPHMRDNEEKYLGQQSRDNAPQYQHSEIGYN